MKVSVVNKAPFKLPQYETKGSAGLDLRANLGKNMQVEIAPSQVIKVPTGLYVELPEGTEMQIRSKSGLTFKHNLIVLNAPGTIDSDFRGQVEVILMNVGPKAYTISHGDKIAQAVVAPYIQIQWNEVAELTETERGAGGFGSTGYR